MGTKFRGYIVVAFLLLLVWAFAEWTRPVEHDWSLSYSREHDRPFGTQLLYEELGTLFPGQKVRSSTESLSRQKREGKMDEELMIFISEKFRPEDSDLELLFSKVRSGGRVFIAARSLHSALLDSVQVGMKPFYSFMPTAMEGEKAETPESDTVRMDLKGAMETPEGGYPFSKGLGTAYFDDINPINSEVIGRGEEERMTYLKVDWGEGSFYLHSRPLAFTNFYLAQKSSYPYAFKALSRLPVKDVYWDEHYKPVRNERPERTPLRFLLQHPSLRAALWLALIGVFFLLSFGAKRNQRPIPVIPAPKNNSLEYARVLARVNFEDGGHQRIARMKAEHFLASLYKRTGMDKERIRSREMWEYVAARAAFPVEAFKEAMEEVEEALSGNGPRTEHELMAFERKLRELGANSNPNSNSNSNSKG